jgi:rod shape-determining protein MreD
VLKFITEINWLAIFIILIAMILTAWPVYDNQYFLPNWQIIALGICYIIMKNNITSKNMIYAIICGVLFDVLTGATLGINSIILVIVTYVFWEYKTVVLCDSLFREMILIASLTFFISVLHISLSRISILPFLPKYYCFSTITTTLIWSTLRLSFYKKYNEKHGSRYS